MFAIVNWRMNLGFRRLLTPTPAGRSLCVPEHLDGLTAIPRRPACRVLECMPAHSMITMVL